MDIVDTSNSSQSSVTQINSASVENPAPIPIPINYVSPPQFPTQQIVEGIRFDFNDGLRIKFPQGNIRYHLIFTDIQTNTTMYNADIQPGAYICSIKKFFIKYKIMIYHTDNRELIYTHTYDASNKDILVQFPDGAIGDTIGWFSYMERFQKKHNCRLTCIVPRFAVQIFQKQYPDIRLITHGDPLDIAPYATYYMGLFFKGDTNMQPIDFRQVGLHRTAAYILGVDPEDIPPRVDLSAERRVKEKYCVINTQASSMTKQWNNPAGWDNVITFLKQQGYKIYCINKDKIYGQDMYWSHLPWGVQDATGPIPLQERINLIKDADFFIGVSSGMSWLAWCCRVPVVLISGFSLPFCQFNTPYRIINYNVCTGCWDDRKEDFDHQDYTWCPRHKGTPQQFQCTRAISPQHVINTIRKIPSFKPITIKEAYNRDRFITNNIQEAKNIILTPTATVTTDQRWEKQTPVILQLLKEHWKPSAQQVLVDFGCGIGRLAKYLCIAGYNVLGVDSSPTMRNTAIQYVNNQNFKVISQQDFYARVQTGFKYDYIYTTWVLQHILNVEYTINMLSKGLNYSGQLFILNQDSPSRAIPVASNGWEDDGIDIWQLCKRYINEPYYTDTLRIPDIKWNSGRLAFYKKLVNKLPTM